MMKGREGKGKHHLIQNCTEIQTLESFKLALRREKLEGDLGDDGLEHWNNPGLLAVLHWILGLFWADVAGVVVVRHRRPE